MKCSDSLRVTLYVRFRLPIFQMEVLSLMILNLICMVFSIRSYYKISQCHRVNTQIGHCAIRMQNEYKEIYLHIKDCSIFKLCCLVPVIITGNSNYAKDLCESLKKYPDKLHLNLGSHNKECFQKSSGHKMLWQRVCQFSFLRV